MRSGAGGSPRRSARICGAARRRRATWPIRPVATAIATATATKTPESPLFAPAPRLRLQRPALVLEPGPGLAVELGTDDLQHLRMVMVDPFALFGRQHIGRDEVALDRREGERLEAQYVLLAGLDLTLDDQNEVLDADPVFAGLVITGLVGEDHAGAQRLVAAGLAAARRRYALRPLMDGEEAADAVAGAVGIIEPGLPEILAREAVELAAAGAVREQRPGGGDMALG